MDASLSPWTSLPLYDRGMDRYLFLCAAQGDPPPSLSDAGTHARRSEVLEQPVEVTKGQLLRLFETRPCTLTLASFVLWRLDPHHVGHVLFSALQELLAEGKVQRTATVPFLWRAYRANNDRSLS